MLQMAVKMAQLIWHDSANGERPLKVSFVHNSVTMPIVPSCTLVTAGEPLLGNGNDSRDQQDTSPRRSEGSSVSNHVARMTAMFQAGKPRPSEELPGQSVARAATCSHMQLLSL